MPSTPLRTAPDPKAEPGAALAAYGQIRDRSIALAEPLSPEDQGAQSMPDASPVKWHLAHCTWFFETFVLPRAGEARPFDPAFGYLFNSYYEALGPRQPRPRRGLLTRPSSERVLAYRAHVDAAMIEALEAGRLDAEALDLLVLGLNHEQQHQELILTDVLHLLAQNPLEGAYDGTLGRGAAPSAPAPRAMSYHGFEGGLVTIGRAGSAGQDFAFDNEGPAHEVFLRPFSLADRLVCNAEWIEFIEAGGYERPDLWLSEGFALARLEEWSAPLYWRREEDGSWSSFTLSGRRPLDPAAPVCHVSCYEADAFARWRGARLPLEAEWEHAALSARLEGNFADKGPLRPLAAVEGPGLRQLYGDVWEWTASPYAAYPGFRPAPGAVGEYNGKFMINQMVLRGGSCATPEGHVRPTYRNFFHPHQRWQFSGLRLARDGVPTRPAAVADAEFKRDVLEGLSATPKRLASKYFYDKAGSDLFEAICGLEEYYPTRVETALLLEIAPDLAARLPRGAVLVEFGSGASLKTRALLDAAPGLSAYAPIDISAAALAPAARAIAAAYPSLEVEPVVGDFTRPVRLPARFSGRPKAAFFPGSTIGNFHPEEAKGFLEGVRALVGAGGALIVGVDLVKERETLERAYDDPHGVTAAFNKNLLVRINRELGGELDPDAFDHLALWNAQASRMEMHLVSRRDQAAFVAGRRFDFAAGERIHTENSYKYAPEVFVAVARSAGWRVDASFISPPPAFAVFLLSAEGGA